MDADLLRRRAAKADALIERGRKELVSMVREASAAGMSQRSIAAALGRSQPEVNRLLRFHGSSPAGLAVRKARREVTSRLKQDGLTNPRIFGSVARGEDGKDSDVDLLVTMRDPIGLLAIARVERDLSKLIGRQVDLVIDSAIRPDLLANIIAGAVPL